MLIERPPKLFRKLFPGVLFRMPDSGMLPGTVYLTFDDGPIPEATPWVLEVLDRFGIKATFFMVGDNARRYPELVDKVKKAGHKIANHSFHHIRGLHINKQDYMNDVELCEEITQTKLFRPPHGYMTPSQLKALKRKYKIVMFDLVTRDYSKRVNADDVVRNIKKYSRDGSIIVFHDSLKSIEKLKIALPDSLSYLQERGFRFGLL